MSDVLTSLMAPDAEFAQACHVRAEQRRRRQAQIDDLLARSLRREYDHYPSFGPDKCCSR
jgi:hypothetical protein